MKKNIRPTFFALPLGISDLKFKNNNSTIIMLGRLYCLWYKRKQNIRIRKKVLKEELFWFSELSIKRALQELEAQNIIVIDHNVYKEERVYEINFTDFFKNKISKYSEAKSNVVDYDNEDIDEIDTEDIEGCDNEDIEEQEEVDNKNVKYTPAQLQMIEENKKYGLVGDDYLPVEGWANTDRQDFRGLLKKYGGKVPEIPEEVLNFDFGQFSDDDFNQYIIDKDKKIYSKPNDMLDKSPIFADENNNAVSVNYLLGLRTKGELALITYLDIYECLTDEYNHLKNNGKI